MERINIAELLKDCPKGMELDCAIYENVTLVEVKEGYDYPIVIETPNGQMLFSKYGCFSKNELAKCVIFPKEKTTWEGFIPPYKFKDGDIYYIKDVFGQEWVSIIKKCENDKLYTYVDIGISDKSFYCEASEGTCYCRDIIEHRLATEEEKKKLFDAIKKNGYKWNPETKTLEKVIQPKFKDGDVCYVKTRELFEFIFIFKVSEDNIYIQNYVSLSVYELYTGNCPLLATDDIREIRLATEEEKKKLFDAIKSHGYKWNKETKTLEKLVEPRFKVGDIIQDIIGICKVKITEVNVKDEYYLYKSLNINGIGGISFNRQNDWVLVPEKFDITTLVPFESRVLVRDNVESIWLPCFFGGLSDINEYPYRIVGGESWKCCIPYEGNEHLLGTTDDCDDFYKTWE